MKIRIGFVSNSSSMSYLVYGVAVNKKKMTNDFKRDLLKAIGADVSDEDLNDDDYLGDLFYEELDNQNLIAYQRGEYFIGKCVNTGYGHIIVDMNKLKEETIKLFNAIGFEIEDAQFHLIHDNDNE